LNDFCGHAFPIELSRELARRGHLILHIYFADNQSTPKGETEAGPGIHANLAIEGLHVPMKFSKHSIRTRRKVDIAYGKAVAARAIDFRSDVVISSNMPLDAQNVLQRAARQQGAKFIFWLQDIYSFAVRFVLKRKLGRLAGMAGAWHYERLEKRLLRNSDGVICIAPGFATLATEWGIAPSRIFMIENWAPLDQVFPTDKDSAWSREHGVAHKFCFMYSGTLGMKHRPELLLELGRYLEARGDAVLIVNAGGAGADWLREHAQAVRKDALTLLPFQPYGRISEVLGASDVLIALLDSDAGTFAVPSKILSYLCAGRALMLAAPRENHAAVVIELAGAGIVISPDRPSEIVDTAKMLMESTELRARYGANARAYAERSFNIAHIADRFLDVISRAGL
jgi:glycosyltransferase involved in cell wall biosynthesis